MRKAQARRLALWVNGVYVLSADHTGFSDNALDEDGATKVASAQTTIALDMIHRSGIPAHVEEDEAIRMVLNNERVGAGS